MHVEVNSISRAYLHVCIDMNTRLELEYLGLPKLLQFLFTKKRPKIGQNILDLKKTT